MYRKSEQYIEGAKLLHDNQHYCLSCHALYYACLHYIKYKLHTTTYVRYKKTYRQQDQDTRGRDSHNFLINSIAPLILELEGRDQERKFREALVTLKSSRKQADYERFNVSEEKSEVSKQKAEKAIEILKLV